MSFACQSQSPHSTPQPQQNTLLVQIQQLQELLDEENPSNYQRCRYLADEINRCIQQQIRKGDDKASTYKLLKIYSQLNRRVQALEQVPDEQSSLLQEETVDIQIYQESVTERKQRLYNVHKSLHTVKNVFQQIAEITNQQVDQMLHVDSNFGHAEQQSKKAATELLKSQKAYSDKLGWRVAVIILLSVILMIMLFK